MAAGADFEPLALAGRDGDIGTRNDLVFAALFFPELLEWRPILDRLRVPLHAALAIAWQSSAGDRRFLPALLASGLVAEADFFRAVANQLGLRFVETIDPATLPLCQDEGLRLLREPGGVRLVRTEESPGLSTFVAAPDGLRSIEVLLSRHDGSRSRLRIATPTAIRQGILAKMAPLLSRNATGQLFANRPEHSARIVANAWQGWVCGASMVALPAAGFVAPGPTLLSIHVWFSCFFLACIGLRLAAFASSRQRGSELSKPVFSPELPVYSVLVALYKEAEVVPQLLVALSKLVWPRDRLEIKLVCEADDRTTIEAIQAHQLRGFVEVVEVPPGGPRTKPKALAYALPLVGGEIVALFDAEDRPHPLQLFEAWREFQAGGEKLACVQASLEIGNGDRGPIACMFAFEYVALFRGLLPWLARHRLVLPLGGTSNHFRRSALEVVGGWDPFNVTEDADLGMRLARYGYGCSTLALPTLEDAPETFKVWLPQRTRWFKGWAQTWLVHMRDPSRLLAEVGAGSFILAQILLAGMVVSALAHPLILLTAWFLVATLVWSHELASWQWALLWIDLASVVGGYVAFLLLGWRMLETHERKSFWRVVVFTPGYWLMMSVAAWRAVWQIWRNPHLWEKTPHRRARSAPEPLGSAA